MVNKEEFIRLKWQPFLQQLDAIHKETKRRTELGYDLAHRLPSQSIINVLTTKCYALTSEYYGADKANISVMYKFLIQISIAAGITFYDPIPTYMSGDGYLELHDLDTQLDLGKEYITNVRGAYTKHGGKIVRGRSAIDNTVPPNIFLQEDGRRLIARQGVMKAVVKFLQLSAKKVERPRIQNAGQLSQNGKEFLWQEICATIQPKEYSDESKLLVNFIHNNPGEYLENDLSKHRTLLFKGLASGELKAVSPTTMAKTIPHRFIKICYTRQIPLQAIQNGQCVTLRQAGAQEVVYLRPNEGHYLHDYHGMSLTSGHQTRILNLFFTNDPMAFNRTNRYPDIEWMVTETMAYNSARELPGEQAVMVGRNSYTGSSIKQTAHGQIVCATLEKFSHYSVVNDPLTMRDVDATIDFLQLGTQPDSSCIKIIIKNPQEKKFLEFVSNLILAMQQHFGVDKIDFQIQIIPTGDRFALIFIPFAMLQQNNSVFTNPNTSFTNVAMGVPEHLHMGNAAGRWSCTLQQSQLWSAAGHRYLQKLYDYASLPGTCAFMQEFVRELVVPKASLKKAMY